VKFKPKALKDAEKIPKLELRKIFDRLDSFRVDLVGDVKTLTNFTPEYRLRVGVYRVLFETYDGQIIVYRIVHRKDVYR